MNLRQTSLACRPAVCHVVELSPSSHAGQEDWEGENRRREGLRVGVRARKETRPLYHSGPQLPPNIGTPALETNPQIAPLL